MAKDKQGSAGLSTEPDNGHAAYGIQPEWLTHEEQPKVAGAIVAADVRGGAGPITSADLPMLFRILDRMISALLVVGFVVLLGVIGVNVFGRMLFGGGVPWADEASRFLFIWLAFLGAAVAYFRREHIAVAFLVDKLPRRLRLAVMILQELLVLVVLCFMMYGAFVLIDVTFRRSALLGIPLTHIFAAVPVASFLMAMMAVYRVGRLAHRREG